MEITVPITSILIIALGSIGVSISIGAAILLVLRKRTEHSSDKLIILLLVLLGCTLLNEVLTTSGITNRFKFLYFIPIHFSLSIAPLFYLFIKSKINRQLTNTDFLHLLIPLIQFSLYLFIGFRSVGFKSELWMNSTFRLIMTIESILLPLSLVIYAVLASALIKKPKELSYFWNDDQINWLQRLAKVFVFVAGLEFMILLGEFLLQNRFDNLIYVLRTSVFVMLIVWVAYHMIRMLSPSSIYKKSPQSQLSILSTEELKSLRKELDKLFEKDKIFLNQELNLGLLAKYLNISDKKCSYFLSEELESNFNQVVNSYRVEAFKEKITANEQENFTLLSLAYPSGFQSKSTFNRAFKDHSGMTPSEYIKSSKI